MALYVLAEHWKTGVGFALWQAGLQHLIEQGYQRLILWVLTGNERAIRFYRSVGCIEETGSERNLERGGAAPPPLDVLTRTLARVRLSVQLIRCRLRRPTSVPDKHGQQ